MKRRTFTSKQKLTIEQFLTLSKNAAWIVKSGDAIAKGHNFSDDFLELYG